MSKQALFYYAENLNLVQQATFTTPAGKEYGLGENGRDLLIFLCNGANEKRGYCFHFGYSYIAEETDIHISTVKRLMAGLEQLGWITRTGEVVRHMGRGAPTVEYELTFITSSLAQNTRTGRPTGRPGATDNLGKANTAKDAPLISYTETETEPETQTETEPKRPRSDDLQAVRQGKEGIEVGEVLRLCIEFETAEMMAKGNEIRPGLRRRWESEYPLLIAKAIEQGHGDTPEALAWHCKDARAIAGYTKTHNPTPIDPLPKPTKGNADCFACKGAGHGLVRDEWGVATTRKCACVGGTWQGEERVSADQVSNTHITTPPASADPQSVPQAIKDLRQNFTHK